MSDSRHRTPGPERSLIETTESTRIAWQGHFFAVRSDTARLPDGSLGPREYVRHPGAAAMVPLFDDGRILIERQYRYPVGQVFVEIPAGKLDAGETPIQTARRELIEETGWEAREWAPLTVIHPAIGFSDERIDIFLCRDLVRRQAQLDAGEFVELDIVTLGWLIDELRAGRLTDVKTQIAAMWLDRIVEGRWSWPAFEKLA